MTSENTPSGQSLFHAKVAIDQLRLADDAGSWLDDTPSDQRHSFHVSAIVHALLAIAEANRESAVENWSVWDALEQNNPLLAEQLAETFARRKG